MRMLVTGAGGMLGQELVSTAMQYGIDVIGLSKEEMDITDQLSIRMALELSKPEIVVNCAGIVRGREDATPSLYRVVNTDGAQLLASICSIKNIKMVQISTDCVFKGDRACTEIFPCSAEDDYGFSKSKGEVSGRHLTLRMSFIGIGKRGLVSWLMKQSGSVNGYTKVKWNGMTVGYASQNIIIAILKDLSGVVHIGGEDTTKYDVLCYLNEALGLGLEVHPVNFPVRDNRLKTIYSHGFVTPPIKQQIEEMVNAYCSDPCRA